MIISTQDAAQFAHEVQQAVGDAKAVKVTRAYAFEDLDENGKANALDLCRSYNVEGEWWQDAYDRFEEDLPLIGFEVGRHGKRPAMTFDINRGAFFRAEGSFDIEEFLAYSHDPDNGSFLGECHAEGMSDLSDVEDFKSWLNGQDEDGNDNYFYVTINRNSIVCRFSDGGEKWEDEVEWLVNSVFHRCLKFLREEYEYLTGDDATRDTIEANGFFFTSNGTSHL